jgi:cytochrome c-type biogenesis protein CcmH/NrfG
MDPNEAQPHMLLATTYRHLGNTEGAKAELEEFQKLSKANMERRRPYDSILKGADEQKEDRQPTGEDDPDVK